MSHALSPVRHDAYIERRKAEKARKTERKYARNAKAVDRARFTN